jgi:Ca2+-binding RTX toxin-like protein
MDFDLKGTDNADVIDLSGVQKLSKSFRFFLNGGEDNFTGSAGRDVVYGGWGDDTVAGGRGGDRLNGGWGNDSMSGGTGDDYLNGSDGKDVLTGGTGSDNFVFNEKLYQRNVDTITDFTVADDTILLENTYFKGLAAGALTAAAFTANASGTAVDATDRIIYETDTGNLYYDRDGSGTAARVLFGQLDAGLALTNADFTIF